MDSRIVESLPLERLIKCSEVGATCHEPSSTTYSFVSNPLAATNTPLYRSTESGGGAPLLLSSSAQLREDSDGRGWRKRIKDWTSVPKYAGTPSLVLLKGWQAALTEAFREARVPEGREQVLAAAHFFTGEATNWWAAIIGQPLGMSLTSFQELCDALDEHFIPQDAALKAIASWKALKQHGTVDEYMRKADEIATSHPMGEVGEFWLIWNGLRPELRAEVRYALREQRKETCSRQDLRKILKGLEVKYPAPVAKPFFPRPVVRQVLTEPVRQTLVVCWICDKDGHRAGECPRRKSTGYARCGSKAHTLLLCPQRRPAPQPGQRQPGSRNGPPVRSTRR